MRERRNCETCMHWDSKPTKLDSIYRRRHLAGNLDLRATSYFGVEDDEPGDAGTLSTGPKFGCVHWEDPG